MVEGVCARGRFDLILLEAADFFPSKAAETGSMNHITTSFIIIITVTLNYKLQKSQFEETNLVKQTATHHCVCPSHFYYFFILCRKQYEEMSSKTQ